MNGTPQILTVSVKTAMIYRGTAMTDQTRNGEREPNPGSREAIAQGCTCPVLDNAHGGGYRGNPTIFVFSGGCPVHWPADAMLAHRNREAGDE